MGKIYSDLTFVKNTDPDLLELFKELKTLDMRVANPFLMTILRDYSNGILVREDLIEIIKLCISYMLRRSICGIPANSLNKTFATFENEINKENYLNSVKAFFIKRNDYKEFPNDQKFGEAFVSKEIYKMRNRNYVLDRLENYNNKTHVIVDGMTIEHIMPQNENLSDEWKNMLGEDWERVHNSYLHTIGNLTITNYNSEMSDRSFKEKMEMDGGFKQSAVRLNSYIILQDTWDESKIRERAELLLEKALKIWPYPCLSEDELAKLDNTIEKNVTNYSLESYNINEYTRLLFEQLDTRIMNLSSSVRKEFRQLYIAYKMDTNFADIVFQEKRLKITINMKYSDVIDSDGICRDVTEIGKWGNGDVEVYLDKLENIEKVMNIIRQSHDNQI